MTLTIKNIRNVIKNYKSSDNNSICQSYHLEEKYNTVQKRLDILKSIKSFDKAPIIIKRFPNEKYLMEWVMSGLSKYEQDNIFFANLSDDTIEFFEEDDLEKKSFAVTLGNILMSDITYLEYSVQELYYIFFEIFPKFGITSSEKFYIIKQLYMNEFINLSHFELYMNDDKNINKLIRLFLKEKIPIFICCINKDEINKFYNNLDMNDVDSSKYKWTTLAGMMDINRMIND